MRIAILIVLSIFVWPAGSKSADRRNFWFLNNTGREIYHVYIAPHSSYAVWGDDVLGRATLSHGMGTAILFYDDSFRCVYDFRIGYADGSRQDYTLGRNLCQTHALQFNESTNDAF